MGWEQAYARAGELAALDQPVIDDSWDYTGVRANLAIALTALGERDDSAPVQTGHLLWHLDRGPASVRQLAAVLLGEELAQATDIDPASVDMDNPAVSTWVWLTRSWPAGGPWGGMSRGVARGLTDPAIDILTSWAAKAALAGLNTERGGPGTDPQQLEQTADQLGGRGS
ncbi:hypothetical protein ACWGQL_30490 [Streptomyces lydicus]